MNDERLPSDTSRQQLRVAWLQQMLADCHKQINAPQLIASGKLVQMTGLTLVAEGCSAALGSRCIVESDSEQPIEAEVVGFNADKIFLMPITRIHGVRPGARVTPLRQRPTVNVGPELLGRLMDACGETIDGGGPVATASAYPLIGAPINPFQRLPIRDALDVGIRIINSMFTVGRGQRLGLFAGSGVGKSVLLGQMTKFTNADVVVVGLIGERGREVREFVEDILGPEGRRRAVIVASPADDPPLMRINGAWRATAIAEYFRDQGQDVLLLMDSLTRFAQAQRELALAIGEPPVSKGYPPSVFALLPQLVERAGNGTGRGSGSITAFYTVLAEGDDQQDPIADASRAILDGHIVLSRDIAQSGIFPAVSVEESISRVMNNVTDPAHMKLAGVFKHVLSTYEKNKDLVTVGAYRRGSDAVLDYAIDKRPQMLKFIQQGIREQVDLPTSNRQLAQLLEDCTLA
jgi:flagellum-specific ATP synthase